MLIKNELCHSNETGHALNPILFDSNCAISFHNKPTIDKVIQDSEK